MIELEIQGLSEKRDGLLIDVGRLAVANGFTLQRQRLAQDPHGILMTMVVRGPERKQRALEAALATYERLISFQLAAYIDGDPAPHFAATRKPSGYVPAPLPPAPASPPVPVPTPAAVARSAMESAVIPPPLSEPAAKPLVIERAVAVESVLLSQAFQVQQDDVEFLRQFSPVRAPTPAAVEEVVTPFVELTRLEADEAAVDAFMRDVEHDDAQLIVHLLALDHAVAGGARESSLYLAGQRVGVRAAQRAQIALNGAGLQDAIARVGAPALQALVDVEQDGDQLHIRQSPLCTEHDHSGCRFYSGFLDGLFRAAVPAVSLSIFEVCCRSYGADDCVLALSY
jgi:predicted hydrocarbon binding protein